MEDPSRYRETYDLRQWYRAAFALLPRDISKIRILELGSGLGEFASVLVQNGAKNLLCTDGSRKYISILKRKGFKAKQFDFNYKFPLKSNSFDMVIGLEVIEHLEKAESFLGEINRVLRRGGLLILSTPNFSWIGYRILYVLGKPPHWEGYHIRYFNYYSLKRRLTENNFAIIKTHSLTPVPILNRFLLKIGGAPIWLKIPKYQNIFAQDLIFKSQKIKSL